ncbi:hypothetical protein ACSLBF_16010 [Pseudoalteromonas sp. T1lg65]|uniref:hypothetical protein n=1 Tax=Pseudoalteromonas sp. T1lg65 TaxID=2077101 RepID=UPI003F7953F3
MIKSLIFRWGSRPKFSAKLFFTGLALFVISVVLIAAGYYSHHLLQLVGLAFMLPAVILAVYGYIGIFANRFSQVLESRSQRLKHLKDNDPFRN